MLQDKVVIYQYSTSIMGTPVEQLTVQAWVLTLSSSPSTAVTQLPSAPSHMNEGVDIVGLTLVQPRKCYFHNVPERRSLRPAQGS